ncbi:MAG: antibiotic biosynthesis monooxygenase [Alphaproteobacteria bacterium]|nr:MAG: antibiotic biosynthesis monooxygenase [Alphaproteobacteria bacterium]
MHGFIAKFQAAPDKRDVLIEIMKQSNHDLPGCISFVIALDIVEPDMIWVCEVWDKQESHLASLELPHVQEAILRATPLVLNMTKIASTLPCFAGPKGAIVPQG